MKKLYLMSAIVLLGVGVSACGNDSAKSDSSSSAKTESVSDAPKASANNTKLAKDLASQFNKDGKVVEAKVEPEVTDDQSVNGKPHQVIIITATNKDTINRLKAAKDANDNGSATDDQKMLLATVQSAVSAEAKKLDNTKDTITFEYKLDADNSVRIALSNKSSDIIPVVDAPITQN